MPSSQENNTVGGGLAALRRHWKLALGIVVLCVVLVGYHQVHKAKVYKATANVTFDSSSLSQSTLAATAPTPDPTRDGPTDALVATSLAVARMVKAQLHTAAPAAALAAEVSAQVAPNANVLQITASAGSPTLAAQLANATATQYINFQTSSQLAAIDKAQADLEKQLATLPATSTQRSTIEASIQRLAPLRAVANGGAQIIGPASPPSSPSGTSTPIVILLALLAGLAIAFIVVFLLESLDRRITSTDQIEAEYRLPLLTTIPEGEAGTTADSRSGQLEPFRILRTTIDLSSDRPVSTLLVTSAVAGEGKTTVAVDLAHAAALTGRRVTLVELDLRRPTFGRHFSIDPRRGFTSVLSGAPLEDMLVEPVRGLPNLRVLPSGPLPPNPADLMQSGAVSEILRELAEDDGLVIIDSPPLNPVADTQVLMTSPVLDGVIVVARCGVSTRDGLRRARKVLDRHLLQPLGIVVTGTADAGQYGYGYVTEGAVDGLAIADARSVGGSSPEPVRSSRRQATAVASRPVAGREGPRSGGEDQATVRRAERARRGRADAEQRPQAPPRDRND